MEKTFRAPRQFKILVSQFFGSLLLLFSLLMLIPTVASLIDWSPKDVLIGSVLTLPSLLLGAAIIYVTQTYIGRIIVDAARGVLIIKKKGRADETHDLSKISRFVLKELIFPMPGFKQFEINAETDDGIATKLFSDDIVLFVHQWSRFSEKLANVANKPLKKDSLIENLNGKMSSK
jgi:hypothetical protein